MSKSLEPHESNHHPARIMRWEIVGLLMLYSFMSWFNRISFAVADERIMEQFQLSSSQIGNIDSALLIAYTLCMTPGGWVIDRFGPKAALIVMGFGSALFVAGTGCVGMALNAATWASVANLTGVAFLAFVAVRALMGSFSAPIYPASAKLVSHWIPLTQRAWANGLITGAAPVGMAAAHVVFGFLINRYTWERAFVITGSITALVAILWAIRGRDQRQDSRPKAPWWTLLRNRSLVLLTISYAAVGYFEYLFNFCSEYYFKGVLLIPEDVSRRYASYTNLAQAAAMPVGGLLADLMMRRYGYRAGRAFVPVLGMLASAGTLFAATRTTDTDWTLVWFVLANAAIGATEGAFWTTAVELGGRRGGTSAGIVNTGGNLGGALAPSVTRGLGQLFGGDWHPGFYIGSLVCLFGAALWVWIDPRERTPDSE